MVHIVSYKPWRNVQNNSNERDWIENGSCTAGLSGKTGVRVADENILRTIGHLNDQQLDDIGMYREQRKLSWRYLCRGVPPTEIIEFDYFQRNN